MTSLTSLASKEDRPFEMVSEPYYASDEQLAEWVQSGNHSAFAQLVERNTNRFYRIAYRYLKDKNDAEDMIQTAFLKFWQQPLKWDPNKNARFVVWFYRVVINLCLDHLKKKKPDLYSEELQTPSSRPNPEEDLRLEQKQKILEKFLTELPERQQTALNLCFYEGLSNQEAADVMGVKLKALQSLLMRAKSTLRHKVQEMELRETL